jgi:hypothetical protein
MKKLYLKADSLGYLEYLKSLPKVSQADLMINPKKDDFGRYRGTLPNAFQEACAKYICEYKGA